MEQLTLWNNIWIIPQNKKYSNIPTYESKWFCKFKFAQALMEAAKWYKCINIKITIMHTPCIKMSIWKIMKLWKEETDIVKKWLGKQDGDQHKSIHGNPNWMSSRERILLTRTIVHSFTKHYINKLK